MGTNFYLATHIFEREGAGSYVREVPGAALDSDDPQFHIGKRSAAGPYCWDCNTTLCEKGEAGVHTDSKWYDKCPVCGKTFVPVGTLKEGAVAVELGFARSNDKRPVGVQTCASFTWAQSPYLFISFVRKHLDEKIVVDEYERSMTGYEFLNMLETNCPVRFTDQIGQWFC